ncbi:MAG: hypothetical protein QOF61_1725 [Acidobacteriota bacterium]|jgi:hypothetical protein|nr:hypothetical protein [Acidobacteriota bacterium]
MAIEMRSHFLALLNSTPLLAVAPILARRRWSIVAGACLVAAVALWLAFGVNAAFVAATLGVLAWFWDQRNRYRATIIEDAGEAEDDADAEEEWEDEIDESDDTDEAGATGASDDFERR